jgi:signal transduction histidine kinase
MAVSEVYHAEGVGLSSMRSRLARVGATLAVEPGPPFALVLSFARGTEA